MLTPPPFSGSFEGGGYTIHGLRVVGMAAGEYGLFGAFGGSSARISNLHLREADIDGSSADDHIGALVGQLASGSIENTSMSGTVNGEDGADWVGGLVGHIIHSVRGTAPIIRNSYATGAVNGGDGADRVGGLTGRNIGTIQNSYATGAVNGGDGADEVGGLIGRNFLTIQNSYATGAVNGGDGADKVGGLIGRNFLTIKYNYRNSDASVTGETTNIIGTGKSMAELQALDAAQTLLDFPITMTDATGGQWSANFWAFGTASQYPALRSYKTDDMANVVEGDLLCGQPAPRAQCP